MNEFKVIEVMNQAMLETKKEKNKDFSNNITIQEVLVDEAYFFKIEKEKALEILKNVGVMQEKLEEVYGKLIAPKMFYDLLQHGKIKENDKSLIIKYEKYESTNLFKK